MQHPLLIRIAEGDESAVKECMDQYGGLVWSLARRFSDSVSDCEDATQEIFLEVWKSASRFDPAKGSETVFIATIARRRLIDRLRSRNRQPPSEEFDEQATPLSDTPKIGDGPVAAETAVAQRALAQLDAGQREVLVMSLVEGMSHSEIASETGRPLGTVKTQARRGLIRIRELIEADSPPSKRTDRP